MTYFYYSEYAVILVSGESRDCKVIYYSSFHNFGTQQMFTGSYNDSEEKLYIIYYIGWKMFVDVTMKL